MRGVLPGVGLVGSRGEPDETAPVDVDNYLTVVNDRLVLVYEIMSGKHTNYY